ncbi:MAG: hypothetical protein QMC95_14600 [Desulfitobacteriaceae bacterium]|nr:hypothetical protein [Desulfitobacteriaceae bacterium]MDI6915424.1 hypothetical protein [Desulfitobacteriaceae bacterium]
MPLEFFRETRQSFFQDPRNGFQEAEVQTEIRHDPITGELTRLFPFRRFRLNRQDWAPVVKASQEKGCPFCPGIIEKATPLFPESLIPGGRLRSGQALVVPNISPYGPYSGVVVMGPEHYLPLSYFPVERIVDGLNVSIEFLRRAREHNPHNAHVPAIGWNYMPYAGGSIIHPHMQALAGPEPSNRHSLLLTRSEAYHAETGHNPWQDLVTQEREAGERYLWQTGDIHWLSSFASRGYADLTVVFDGKSTLHELTAVDIEHFAQDLHHVLRFYDSLNLPSFNLAIYPAPDPSLGYTLNARIVGRFTVFDWTSDINTLQLLFGDFYTLTSPEDMATHLRNSYSIKSLP